MIRARRPFVFRNAVTGAVIATFAAGVFVFTLRAVGQDKFEDVIVPNDDKTVKDGEKLRLLEIPEGGRAKTPNVAVNGLR